MVARVGTRFETVTLLTRLVGASSTKVTFVTGVVQVTVSLPGLIAKSHHTGLRVNFNGVAHAQM